MHLFRLRTSAMNRTFGMLTQWGLRLSLKRLREPNAIGLLEARGVPAACRDSIVEADRRPSSAATPAWRRASNSPATARHRRALQGRIADTALGRDRSRPTGLAADQPLARPLPRRRQAPRPQPPAKSAVARKVLIAAWHVLARNEPFKPNLPRGRDTPVSASSSTFLAA